MILFRWATNNPDSINEGVTVYRIFEIPKSKHQIPIKSQIPNSNDPNCFDFSQFLLF